MGGKALLCGTKMMEMDDSEILVCSPTFAASRMIHSDFSPFLLLFSISACKSRLRSGEFSTVVPDDTKLFARASSVVSAWESLIFLWLGGILSFGDEAQVIDEAGSSFDGTREDICEGEEDRSFWNDCVEGLKMDLEIV